MKRSFFHAAVVSILLYGIHHMDANKTFGEKSWWQLHKNSASNIEQVLEATPHKQQLYCHLLAITKTIKIRRTKHVGHCWRSKDELISNVLLWTSSHGWAKVGRPARTYIQQLCADTGYSLEDLSGAMDDKDRLREGQGVHASSVTW